MVQDLSPTLGTARRSPGEQLKRQILCDRLRLTDAEIENLMLALRQEGSELLGMIPGELELDVDFSGRELDFLFRFARPKSTMPRKSR